MSIVKKARATNPRMEWLPLGAPEFGTMAEAKKHLQNMEGSKWKWARPSGDAKTIVGASGDANHRGTIVSSKFTTSAKNS